MYLKTDATMASRKGIKSETRDAGSLSREWQSCVVVLGQTSYWLQ